MTKQHLLLLLLTWLMATGTFAAETEINGLWYELVSKTKEGKVIQYKNSIRYKGDISIPPTVEYEDATYNITSIDDYAFSSCNELTSVTIPSSVKNIGKGAFRYCSKLTTVTIPNSVEYIEESVFESCI